jgi:hypothetical protein
LRKAQPRKAAWRIWEADEVAAVQLVGLHHGAGDDVVVRALQVRDGEVDLAGEVAVERRERHLGLLDDALDSDAVDALGIEQLRRGGEKALARLGALLCGTRFGGSHISRNHRRESDRS